MFLKISHINKSFGQEQVLQDLSFSLEAQRLLSILGRSGSGKTTLLKIIAGLETPDGGSVELDGKAMDNTPAHLRNIVYLYQEPLLFTHLNAFENIAFGLRLRKLPEAEIRQKTEDMLASLELSGQSNKMPDQLSGGQRQRVSFGRALIINPRVLLLDEPFGALDTETRQAMQQLLKRIVADFKITTLFVTHDLKEALLMGDEIALMQDGILKKYKTKTDFIQDAQTGVQEEIGFWERLK
jgi:ABC-type Fe3+/spermidine/putrescine transport system ATPase subunit